MIEYTVFASERGEPEETIGTVQANSFKHAQLKAYRKYGPLVTVHT